MPIAIATILVGYALVYQALTGESLAGLFSSQVGKLNPKGGRGGSGGSVTPSAPPAGDSLTEPERPGLPGVTSGTRVIDGHQVAGWIAPVVLWARDHGWPGQVTSGYRSDSAQRDACIHVCGNPNGCPGTCAPPGQSNHRGTKYPLGAVDVSYPAEFARAIASYPGGPPVKNDLPSDRVHFSASGK